MTLSGLLAIIGILIAVYALARPAQRKSIGLFVPLRAVIVGLSVSGGLLIALEVMLQWEVACPPATFALGTGAVLIPIGIAVWAALSWHRAVLTKETEPRFREFLLSCLRDAEYDEAVRILTQNRTRLASVLTKDTADLVFDRQFVRAMVSARTWLHLELLTDESLLETLPNYRRAVDRTFRVLLAAEESPLRISALLGEGGDETIGLTDEEADLIGCTLLNPTWYRRCGAGYPLVIAACEKIDSGELDEPYNRADARYGALQGIARRSRCPVFLAEKTIVHALKAAIEQNSGTTEDAHRDAADLWELFRAIFRHSIYRKETWDEPFGYGDYPTPFGFLLGEILSDYYFICEEAWHRSKYGSAPPPKILGPVIRMWAHCVVWSIEDEDRVSPSFRMSHVTTLLEMTLSRRHAEVHANDDNRETRAAWAQVFVEHLKEVAMTQGSGSREYLRKAIHGMDYAKDHIRMNRDWLREELGIERN